MNIATYLASRYIAWKFCHAAINGALLCVTQLLQLFRYFEFGRGATELGVKTPVLGLCTGSLAAAAFAATGSLDDLELLAAPVVAMAFQLGVHAATAGDMLYQRTIIWQLAGIQDSLQAPVRVDLIINSLASQNVESVPSTISIDIVNPVTVTKTLVAALKSRNNAAVSSQDLLAAPTEDSTWNHCAPSFNNEPLAIVGMSGRFPDADSAEALWTILSEGKDTHKVVPQDRFNIKTHVDTNGRVKNASYTPYGCFIKRSGDFDPKFFNMSPKEALQTDPMQILALVTAYEALEQAGFVPNRTRSSALDRVGTFYGQTSDDYRDVNAYQDIGTYFITGGIRAFGPGRINYFFKFSGPSYSVDTACSSSLAAIQLACTAIWNGECDVAVAGGLSVLTSPDLFCGLSRGQFLSKTGSCKTFDNEADGYYPHDVGYIEMHGTGTQAGDGTEMHSVADVFARPARSQDNPLYVGAAKANVGHGEASSGVVSLIKSIMIMQKGVIPPHVGIKSQINANFPDLQALNIRIASRMTQLPTSRKPRTMLVNNFSAAGPKVALDEMAAKLSEKRVRHTQLRVPYAFHSAQVEPILQEFEELARSVRMTDAHTTIVSSTLGRVMSKDEKNDASYLSRHCRQAVRFKQAIQHAQDSGIIRATTTMVEFGPHPICSGMVKSTLGYETKSLHTLKRQQNPWKAIVGSLVSLHDEGFKINWSEYYRDFEASCRLIHLPAYAFDIKNYWIEYKNDWTLRKGEALPPAAPLPESTKSPLISSSVHRVVEDRASTNDPVVVFESDLSHIEMHTAIAGHRVNGASLCPFSLYADIALTIAKYIQQATGSGFFLDGYDVCDMDVHKPLLVAPNRKDERKWLKRWSHHLHFVDDRIRNLDDASENDKASTITKRLAYRLFASLVDYSSHYHRMNQVVFDSEGLEATAVVSLDPESDKTGFSFSPYNLDGLLHLSGLILNGNETFDHTKAVYNSHGWESLRLAKPLRVDADYKVYVKMLPTGKNMVAGNLYVISANEILAVCEGIRFQQVPRAVLNLLLPPADHRRTQKTTSVEAPEKTSRAAFNLQLSSADHKGSQAATRVNELKKIPPTARPMSPPKTPPTTSKVPESKRCLEVIATEIGLSAAEISPSDSLAELGVDSLMSLALAGRLKSECDIDIDHSKLMTCDTVADLLAHVSGKDNARSSYFSAAPPFKGDTCSIRYPPTPPLDDSLSDSTTIDSEGASTPMDSSGTDGETFNLIRITIIEETGIEPENLDFSTDLANLGVDSLMNLAILSKLRDQGVDLPTSFFLEHQTLEQIQRAVSRPTTPPVQPQQQVAKSITTPPSPSSPPPTNEDPIARHILLQKPQHPTSTSNKTFFLFPDGSGSPYAYTTLTHLHPSFTTYGLTSSFHSDPSAYTCGLENAVRIYLRTIKSIQPSGPYYLGGRSVGGVLAFEAARQLGEGQVGGLVLIDAPCPLTLPPMNGKLIGFLEEKGLFEGFENQSSRRGHVKMQKVLRHFEATVENLGRYRPRCISNSANTLIVWAREGVLSDENRDGASEFEGDPTAAWILDKRQGASDHGWRKLLPRADMEAVSVPGNHFSMMTGNHTASYVSDHWHILQLLVLPLLHSISSRDIDKPSNKRQTQARTNHRRPTTKALHNSSKSIMQFQTLATTILALLLAGKSTAEGCQDCGNEGDTCSFEYDGQCEPGWCERDWMNNIFCS
ncbi:ketoacyl-synt-domain-containing protein [Teratosphaeria nubilosa]|uniref:Ketoacyl-synt-domain-containing protein n=1 Tax=Teratosphaeria nubilosa TaxID=161662 RepID=A0A6G1L1X3_9PEZI|nr:ketoacyl-synt-domain-containing protein [Teratosphaeria nubilosa]